MNILYFSQVPWRWIKQRPHFLPEALSKLGYNVTFFSIATGKQKSCFMDKKFRVKEIRGMRGSAKLTISRKINEVICKKALEEADYEIIILTYPFQYEYLTDSLKQKPILYDCMDIVPNFYTGNTKRYMETIEKKLCDISVKVVASSKMIVDSLQTKYGINEGKISLIRNAMAIDIFQTETIYDIKLNNNNAVYVGTIDSWIDFDTIYQFCRENKDFYIYMVGPVCSAVKDQILKAPPNIIFTGAQEHKVAMEYIKKAKVALIPFVVTDLIKGVDPVKLYEYIALGKPVVAAYWAELKHFNNQQIYFYDEKSTFSEAIEKAKDAAVNISDDFIIKNSWDERSRELDSVIKSIINPICV